MSRARLAAGLALAAIAIAAAACSDATDTGVNQLNLDRPIDVAFGCYGGLRITNGSGVGTVDEPIAITAQATAGCDFRSTDRSISEAAPLPVGQEDLSASGGSAIASVQWVAFVLQSEPGTVSISTFDTKPSSSFVGGDVIEQDADPLTPGENGISVGEDPIALATDKAGCFEMVANSGSCDLSALDITTALDTTPGAKVDRLAVVSSTGAPIRSKPAAMVGEPGTTVIGNACPATPTGLMYIAYPSCHAVAIVDVSTGAAVGSIQFDATGVATIGDGNLTCPDECGGGGVATAGTRPVSMDLFVDPRVHTDRMVIGADNSAVFTVVEIDPTSHLPASLFQLPLENKQGNLGVTQVAMSPQVGVGISSGIVSDVGSQFQYVYGVATDGTVRVADIFNVRKECDTQVDPRQLFNQHNVAALSCMPVGDPATPPRRPGAIGPGIQLTGTAIPVSVATFKAENFAGDTRSFGPQTLLGYFGVITATSGSSFVFNITDDDYGDSVIPAEPLEVQIPFAISNQLRDSIPDRDAIATATTAGTNDALPICDTDGPDPDATTGNLDGPRAVTTPPLQNGTTGFIAANKLNELPTIRQVNCISSVDAPAPGIPVSELSFAANENVRSLEYPDIRGLTADETWTLTWEGPLSQDDETTDAEGPPIRTGQIAVAASNAMSLVDETGPFCNAGVQVDDVVQLRGCDPSLGDAECPLGYTCFIHPDSKVAGLGACMLEDEASRLADACREYLISLRRYSVARAKTGELVVVPRTHVLVTSPLDGCANDAQCQALADYADREVSTADPVDDTTAKDTHTWACRADTTRATIHDYGSGATGSDDFVSTNRCVETCTTDDNCDIGAVCNAGTCVEGVIPPQACVNAPQRYDLRASEAFTVIGVVSGFVHAVIADATGNCVADPTASPFKAARIPLRPAPCDPGADPRTGLKADGVTFDANPCSLTTTENEIDPVFLPQPDQCTLANPSSITHDRLAAPAVRFHDEGMTLTVVDPYYPGDQTCVQDRLGTLGEIPLVFDGYQLAFRQTAGFSPLVLDIQPAFPVKVVRGPTNSIWVMDDGDFLSTDVTVASTEGKVFRIEPVNLSIINLLE